MSGRLGGRLSASAHRVGVALAAASLATAGLLNLTVRPAAAASPTPMSITVTASPNPVSSGQALAYTITVTNTGGFTASGLTITDTLTGVAAGSGMPAPAMSTNLGSCNFNTGQVTCNAASLAAGQVWTATITGQVTAAAGTTLSNTATVTGTESSAQFSASATTTTTINQNLPAGFAKTQLAHGLSKPVVVAFAPNGDIYLGEQGGTIKIYRNGAVLPTPLVTLPNVYSSGECGLLGIAFDPNFASNGYLYVSYTFSKNTAGVVQPFAQLSRFTVANGTINPTSEKVYLRGNQAQNLHHPGNDLRVGPDGKLWWSVGDNVPAISNGHTLTNIYGKMLRLNLDGTIPADNPFVNVPKAVPAIYATGLRNPFRFTFLPTGEAMTEDTGSSYWEELDTIQRGGDYGWPYVEGDCGSCGFINPAYNVGHLPTDAAASAIAAYSGSVFPTQYRNVVFVGDYNRRDIEAIAFDPTYKTEISDTVFDNAAGTIADLEEGPDGNLYYVGVFEGTFTKISAVGPFAPTASATATPSAGTGPLTVQFSSAGSSDPYGLPLTYTWDFGDGSASSTAANPSHTYANNGTYTATVTAGNGSQSSTATTQVTVGRTPPSASISAPTTYNAGDTIAFSGSATDATNTPLPAYAYNWKVDFSSDGVVRPSYYAEVATAFYGPISGISSGSFQIPTDPSQTATSFYRITLTVTDSSGIQTVVTKDLHPKTTTWSANTDVAGTGYWVDGAWQTGLYTTPDVVGVRHVLAGVPLEQTVAGVPYRLAGWADGSALTDSITASSAGGSYTSNYEQVQSTLPTGWQSADVSATLPGTTDYSPSTQSFYLDGAGADVYGANEQFRYMYQTLNGDGTIVARVRYQSNSDPWAKAGVMIKQSAAAGVPFVDALVSPDVSASTPNTNGVGCNANGCLSPLPPISPSMGHGARMQYSGSHSATPSTYPPAFRSPNKWLKLQKAGSTFTSWMSSDGLNWTQIGIATVSMSGPTTIGLFVTSHDIGQYSTAAFDNVNVTANQPPPPPGPLPSPWVDTDVGSPALAGSASYTNGVFTVNGAGADIYGTNDQFNYVNQPVSGNGTLIARVTSQSNTSSNAKAGVMFKQSTAAGSSYFLIAVAPGGGIKVQYNFNSSVGGGTYPFPNVWMKLTKTGSTFAAYVSGDGVNWTSVFSKALTTTDPVTTGLFVCSHNTSALGTATFDNVSYTPGP